MLRQFSVQIPKSQWSAITEFLDTSVEHLQIITEVVSSAEPLSDVEDLAESVAAATGINRDTIDNLLTIAVQLSHARHEADEKPARVLERIAESLQHGNFPEWKEKYAQAWHERQPMLEQIIAINGAIDVMAKVRGLLFNFQSVLLDSAVLTDVRHIYDEDASRIVGGLILHTVSLEYFDGTQPHQLHVTLSATDVSQLILQLQRSERKADVAMKLLTNAGLPELTPRKIK